MCKKMTFLAPLGLSLLVLAATFVPSALAQREPPLPPPLQNLRDEGAQMRYLGNQGGLNGWIAIQGGQEQYFYVTEDGQSFVMGLLFDRDGRVTTVRQVQQLQQSADGETLDMFMGLDTAEMDAQREQRRQGSTRSEFRTPAEQLYSDLENSNWVAVGKEDAPVVYSFIDPRCPYCHDFINDLRGEYLDNGHVQLRMIPVGFREDTIAQAALLLAVPNPESRWFRHMDGDETALPPSRNINDQGVQRNLAVMQSWDVNVTPFTVYRAASGEIKILQGRARDVSSIINDLR